MRDVGWSLKKKSQCNFSFTAWTHSNGCGEDVANVNSTIGESEIVNRTHYIVVVVTEINLDLTHRILFHRICDFMRFHGIYHDCMLTDEINGREKLIEGGKWVYQGIQHGFLRHFALILSHETKLNTEKPFHSPYKYC